MSMRRAFTALLTVLPLLLLPAAAVPAAAVPAAASPTIMIVGSSTSHGSSGDYTWRYRLWRHLTGAGVAVDFVGPSNRLYDNVHSAPGSFFESDAYADPAFDRDHASRWGKFVGTFGIFPPGAKDTLAGDVATYQPDYAVIMLGLNDLVWFHGGGSITYTGAIYGRFHLYPARGIIPFVAKTSCF